MYTRSVSSRSTLPFDGCCAHTKTADEELLDYLYSSCEALACRSSAEKPSIQMLVALALAVLIYVRRIDITHVHVLVLVLSFIVGCVR